jgi:hypothetical protein
MTNGTNNLILINKFGRFICLLYLCREQNTHKMEDEVLQAITHTVEGYEVKDLIWKPTDNIIRGLVKDPVTGRESLHNGFVVSTWKKNGSVTQKYGGNSRLDLYLLLK